MEPHTDQPDRPFSATEIRQREAEERQRYHSRCRVHVTKILSTFGKATFYTLHPKDTEKGDSVNGAWMELGDAICDFTEFLDEN